MILRPDGSAVSAKQQETQLLGYVVMRNEGHAMVPMSNDKGHLAIFQAPQPAVDVANQMAQAELRPSAEQKIVTPQMKSRQYLVIQCLIVGAVQAQIKNPEQLLAPKGEGVN